MSSSATEALIKHVPPPGFTVSVVPLISQIVDKELVVKVTALPDELVALKV
jgi:predicted thioesterase